MESKDNTKSKSYSLNFSNNKTSSDGLDISAPSYPLVQKMNKPTNINQTYEESFLKRDAEDFDNEFSSPPRAMDQRKSSVRGYSETGTPIVNNDLSLTLIADD